ncbi:hypothetical protein COBT_000686 [Conglomerata obtusa]
MHCCGMSMLLTKSKKLTAFLVKSKPITEENFYCLLLGTFIASMLNEILLNTCSKIGEKKCSLASCIFVVFGTFISFFVAWGIMMLSMTSNVYVLFCITLLDA